jgi:purine nucleoside permease
VRLPIIASAGALLLAAAAFLMPAPAPAAELPIPIRVVVVTTFEIGADTGDTPGEFQHWVERLPLPATLPLPLGYHDLRYDPARQILGIVTGEGAERGAASIMALGTDPRFDLSHAYWVIAGIAGIDPAAGSVGSAAWANWVVNGDLAFEVDPRDAPAAWSIGIVPRNRAEPYATPAPEAVSQHGQLAYALNPALVQWAYHLTAAVPLPDDANLRSVRAPYARFPKALQAPSVLVGDTLASDRFWIGAHLNAWAEAWVPYWTGSHGTFVTTAEEDAGIMQSLTFLAHGGRVDAQRILVLRTASDYDIPGDGSDAAALVRQDAGVGPKGESGFLEALEAAYRVGSVVVNELASHWDRYVDRVPGP